MEVITATRQHSFDAGHRVVRQGGACEHLHGHLYNCHFTCAAELNDIGMVLDFGVMKTRLGQWIDDNLDHKFLAWSEDEVMRNLVSASIGPAADLLEKSIVWVPYNPTAELIANHLLTVVGPQQLEGTGVKLVKVIVEETRKCSASAELV